MIEFLEYHLQQSLTPAQLWGWAGLICAQAVYQFKTARQMRIGNILTSTFFGIHYYLMGAIYAASLSAIGVFYRLALTHNDLFQYRKYLAAVALALSSVFFILFFDGWISAFIYVGMIFSIAMDFQSKALHMRFCALLSVPCWLVYNFLIGSQGGFISTLITMTSNVIGFARHQLWPYMKTRDKRYFDI